MKKGRRLIIALVIVCACLFMKTEVANAQSIECNKTIKIDLNGDGKKESLRYTTSGEFPCRAKVYVNNKKILSTKNNSAFDATLSVVDINKKDRYKDIYLQFTSYSDVFEGGVCGRYINKKWKQSFTFNPNDASSYRLGIAEKQPGNGKVDFEIEYHNPYAMQGYAVQSYQINSANKLKPIGKTVLNTTNSWRKQIYRTTKSVKVYKNIGDGSSAFTMRKGTKYYVYKVKLKTVQDNEIAYIYVKTSNGKTGWVKIPKSIFCQGRWSNGEWSDYAYLWG